jgi:hypothetical protein
MAALAFPKVQQKSGPLDLESDSDADVLTKVQVPEAADGSTPSAAPQAAVAGEAAPPEAASATSAPSAAEDVEIMLSPVPPPSLKVVNQVRLQAVESYLQSCAADVGLTLGDIDALRQQERQFGVLMKRFPPKRELDKRKQAVRLQHQQAFGNKKLAALNSIFSDDNLEKMTPSQLDKAQGIVGALKERLEADETLKCLVPPKHNAVDAIRSLCSDALWAVNEAMELHAVKPDHKRGRDLCDVLEEELYKKVKRRVSEQLSRLA